MYGLPLVGWSVRGVRSPLPSAATRLKPAAPSVSKYSRLKTMDPPAAAGCEAASVGLGLAVVFGDDVGDVVAVIVGAGVGTTVASAVAAAEAGEEAVGAPDPHAPTRSTAIARYGARVCQDVPNMTVTSPV